MAVFTVGIIEGSAGMTFIMWYASGLYVRWSMPLVYSDEYLMQIKGSHVTVIGIWNINPQLTVIVFDMETFLTMTKTDWYVISNDTVQAKFYMIKIFVYLQWNAIFDPTFTEHQPHYNTVYTL